MLRQPAGIAAIALTCALLAVPARSADAPPPAAVPDYHPSLADLMTMGVQSRHIKLGLAGKERNWAYVTYESSELRNAFTRVARTIPVYRQIKLADMFAAGVIPTLDELDAAIKAKDPAKFDAAYGKLTESCDTCHVALEHAYVVIRAPQASPYPDQDFKASK
jgi:hypothetical protein